MKRKAFYFILTLVLFTVFAQSCFYSPKYMYRVIAWQDADYDDFKRFKSAPIEAPDTPFFFTPGTEAQKEQLRRTFTEALETEDLEQFLERQRTHSFIVIRNDTILYENYFNDNDRESVQTSFSVSKSILSLLVGIAIEQGHISGIDDPITSYLPELTERDPRFEDITVGHLLSMRSGIEYSGKISFPFVTADDPKTYYHPDLRRVALKHTNIDTLPGTRFRYNNYNALLIGLILERTTEQPVSTYMQDNIWRRIGAEFEASWSQDEREFEKMESGFNARAIDFAKLGRLALNKGSWDGQQLISRKWVSTSTQPKKGKDYVYGDPTQWTYRYFWWGIPEENVLSDFMAIGNMGQLIYVSPRSNTIIARNGNETDDFGDANWIIAFHKFVDAVEAIRQQ